MAIMYIYHVALFFFFLFPKEYRFLLINQKVAFCSQCFECSNIIHCINVFIHSIVLHSALQMAEEISKPLSEAKKVTMVSSGGAEVGASKLAGEVLDIMTKLPSAVEKLTGVDISQVRLRICVKLKSSA